MPGISQFLHEMLQRRLAPSPLGWLRRGSDEITEGASDTRLGTLLSAASRHAPRAGLAPSAEETEAAARRLAGWNPERWTTLDAMRAVLVLARTDLEDSSFAKALEGCFSYADEGELCALYRSLALLPAGERFVQRAREGCCSNMRSVFEAVACDSAYPARFFDEDAWRQLVLKAVFVGAPLWRVHGLDARLSPELARMALDFVDERRSAGRSVPPELWLCLGRHGGERGHQALLRELHSRDPRERRAGILGLARAGHRAPLEELARTESVTEVRRTLVDALEGRLGQVAFRALARS
jgi:hypothetical protein